ncbi:MAG: SDR family oxidoreductase, partial [Clostridia bacterium]|nr:SDR family oxidoreductase [Clostridia bacterium]
LQKNYRVCVTYTKDEESAEKAKALGLEVYRSSVENENEVQSLFAQIGEVDILVNNAGVSLVKQIQDTSLDEYEKVFAVNMRGVFLCAREACKAMLSKKSGLIVNISSVWGGVGGSCESVYSASKSALLGFTKALAKELGYSGIRVNAISAGVIDTKMNACFSKEEMESLQEEIPLGRIGTGTDIAKTVLFLEENDYITGVDIPVNGGFSVI